MNARRGRWTRRIVLRSAAAGGVLAVIAAAWLAASSGAAQTAGVAPSNALPPSVAGLAQVGSTLTASPGSWNGDTPIAFAYAWQRCNSSGTGCSAIGGATGQTYLLVPADSGSTLRVDVTATNAAGASAALSTATPVVTAGPVNTVLPTLGGTAQAGQTLTAGQGTWTASGAISYTYQWKRCNSSGASCVDASAVIAQNTITLASADVGHTIRAAVTATAGGSSTTVLTAPSALVLAASTGPVNTALPTLSGTAQAGQTLTAGQGTWTASGAISYTYQWKRCDSSGASCVDASAVITQNTITLASADVGHTIRAAVTATTATGSTTVLTAQSAIVTVPSGPSGGITLPDGHISVPAAGVSLPDQLVISRIAFTPSRLTSRAPFTLRVWVTDTNGYAVRDALVLATGLPYGWVRQPAEATTTLDGSLSFQVQPTAAMPVRRSALVFFLRVRKLGDNPLAGVSTRRLVQVGLG